MPVHAEIPKMAMRVDDRSAVQSGHAGSSVFQVWFAMAAASVIALALWLLRTVSPFGPVMQRLLWRPCWLPPISTFVRTYVSTVQLADLPETRTANVRAEVDRRHCHGNLVWRMKDRELDFCVRRWLPLATSGRLRSEGAKRSAVDGMSLNVESVVDGGVNRQEALC